MNNLIDMDPLGSYNQYSAYHSPFHPQTSHSIPQIQSTILQTQSTVLQTQSTVLQTQSTILQTQSTAPQTQSTVLQTQSTVLQTPSTVLQTQSTVLQTQSTVLQTQSTVLQTQSTVSQLQCIIPEQPNISLPPILTNSPHIQSTSDVQPNISVIQPNLAYPYLSRDYYLPPFTQPINQEINDQPNATNFNQPTVTQYPTDDTPFQPIEEEEDIKPDISKIKLKLPRKPRGKTSSYWNKKILDKDFKFFGCSVCNIAFQELTELDTHVTIHSNRITSYDIRVKNLKRRKQLRKEKKKAKIKNELLLDIKPEDGFIGMEKAGAEEPTIKKTPLKKKKDLKCKDLVEGKNLVYKCFACNKQFALSYYLKIHVRSHTDEKPYTCNTCGLTFITASKLGRHTKRIHLAIRHQCRICFCTFSRFELLTKHFDKKHLDQKLEGEPYDYNAILPYLTDLEDQFKLEEVKKPKTENLWDWGPEASQGPLEASEPDGAKVEVEVQKEEDEKKTLFTKFEFADDTYKGKLETDIKTETQDEEEPLPISEAFDDTFIGPHSDNEVEVLLKEERAASPPTDDEEYFPPGGWARSPPQHSPSPPHSPLASRKRGRGSGACDLCKRSFSSKSYLKVHMRTHTGEKPFSCYVCNRGFITASKMHRHVLTHDETWVGEKRIKPEGADIKSENEDDEAIDKVKRSNSKIKEAKIKLLKKPNKKMDPKLKMGRTRKHCCEYCGKKFLHIETLQVHQKSHEGEELVIRCHYCLEPQLDQEARAEHEVTHTGPKPYYCTLCGRHYKDRGPMLYHRKNHKPSDEKLFICDICSKRFNSQTKLARHIVTHSSERFVLRYECPVCANMFHTRWHVQMHLKSHQKEGLILEENRNAVLAMVLQNARKIPKTPNGTFQPPTTTPQPPTTNPYPPDERSRICNICGQVFQHFYYLEEHLKTHGNKIAVEDLDKEEEKKYTCQVCSKSFKLHYYLKLHSFTHTKEKPFTCQQCGKGFITKGKLKRHLETHQGLKKYQCHICCKFFTRPSYMRIHVRTIHGTQDYNFRDYGVGVPLGLNVVPVSDY